MKLANPLHYPLAVLAGGIVLVVSVRLVNLPHTIMLPVAAAIATAGAAVLKTQEPETPHADNPSLARELLSVKQQAQSLAEKAHSLRAESELMLTSSTQLDLLTTVQYTCDRAQELPGKIDQLTRRFQGANSLLSVAELQKQLGEVELKQQRSSGIARQQLDQLAASLERNLALARQGEDARQAQIISLSTLISDSAGVLQQLQNRLRTSNLEDSAQLQELRELSEELNSFQENLEVLVS